MHPIARLAESLVDGLFSVIPQPMPSRAQLEAVQIIAHRGVTTTATSSERPTPSAHLENTLAAFDQAQASGCDGIEFDVRWTKDEVPVVLHDHDGRRVFNDDSFVHQTDFFTLRQKVRDIPTLEEIVQRYPQLHLMIELKATGQDHPSHHGLTRERVERLAEILKRRRASLDFHLMSLEPEALEFIAASGLFPAHGLLSIALVNTGEISRATLSHPWGGFTGHYVLISETTRQKHRQRGQKIGTGFIQSENVFKRECARDVSWIFSNRADEIARIRRRLLGKL